MFKSLKGKNMIPTKRTPTLQGEILLEEFLKPGGISPVDPAHTMGVPVQRINTMMSGKSASTAETALLLSRDLGTSPEFWMNLHRAFALYKAKIRLKAA